MNDVLFQETRTAESAAGISTRMMCVFALLVIASVYLAGSVDRAAIDADDGVYLHVAQQMLERGDWVTPWVDGVRSIDKPPLLYWLLMLSYKAFGVTEFAARVPTLLCVLLTAWILMRTAAMAGGEPAGAYAGLMWSFSIGTFLFTREAMHDALLVLFFSLATYSFLDWYLSETRPRRKALLFYAALAGAMLSKSLIGVLLPLAAVTAFLLWRREWKLLARFAPVTGWALFLALAAPWHVMMAWRNPYFLSHFFVNEQFLRFFNRREPMDYSSIPLPLFWVLFLAWLFPWTVFLPAAVRQLRVMRGAADKRTVVAAVNLLTGGIVLAFFSISSRLEHYSFPVLGPMAVAISLALFPGGADSLLSRSRWGFRALAGFSVLMACSLAGAGIWAWHSGYRPANILQRGSVQVSDTDFGPIFLLPPDTQRELLYPLAAVLCAFIAIPLIAWLLERRGRRATATLTLCGMMIVFCLAAQHALFECEDIISSKRFGLALKQFSKPGGRVIINGDYEGANSIQFYAPVELQVYGGKAASLEGGLRYPDAPQRILNLDDVRRAWTGVERVFLIATESGLRAMGLDPVVPVSKVAGRMLVTNRPLPAAPSYR